MLIGISRPLGDSIEAATNPVMMKRQESILEPLDQMTCPSSKEDILMKAAICNAFSCEMPTFLNCWYLKLPYIFSAVCIDFHGRRKGVALRLI
jgi:hypothetical protein